MEMQPYKVYIKTDESGRITAINSDAFLSSLEGWQEIASGNGDKYHHAQGNYFDKPLYDERGIHCYMTDPVSADPDREAFHTYEYEGEQWGVYERTQAEMDADYTPPILIPDPTTRIADLEAAMAAIEEGIASV